MSFTSSQRRALLLAPVYVVLAGAAVFTLIPFAWLLCAAFKTNADVFASNFLPRGDGFLGVEWGRLTMVNFSRLFSELGIGRAMTN